MSNQSLQHILPGIYTGGAGDGYSIIVKSGQNQTLNIYTGGANDGWNSTFFTQATIFEFTGSGNWNVPANWKNNLVPPSPLPAGAEILINPTGGNCILNVPQLLAPGSKITVINSKTFIINNLQ
jgi:hypothetical protein